MLQDFPMWDCGDGFARPNTAAQFPKDIVVKTAAYTIDPTEFGKCFSNRGAEASVTFTLPTPKVGMKLTFIKEQQDQDLVVDPPTGVKVNDQTAGKNIKNTTTETGIAVLKLVGFSSTEYMIAERTGAWVGEDDTGTPLSGLEEGTDGQIIVGQSGSAPLWKTVSGDVTVDADGAVTIGAQKVLNTMLERGTDGQLLIGQTGAATDYKSVTGDVTIDKDGVTTIGANKVLNTMLERGTNGQLLVATTGADADWKSLTGSVALTAAGLATLVNLNLPTTARTATADGTTTGTIADGTGLVLVTSDSADKIIILPTPTPGTIAILHVGATGYELRSSAPGTVAINGGAEANAESAIPANTVVVALCVTATAWFAFQWNASGIAQVEPAAAGA